MHTAVGRITPTVGPSLLRIALFVLAGLIALVALALAWQALAALWTKVLQALGRAIKDASDDE